MAGSGAVAADHRAMSDAEAFRHLSAALTGMPAENLPGFGEALRQSLAASAQQKAGLEALLALARTATPEALRSALHGTALEPLARAVAAGWYTGTLGAGGGARVLSYEDALVWRAAGYDSAPSLCGGEFGHWSEPPSSR
jgi:hypothetical protein